MPVGRWCRCRCRAVVVLGALLLALLAGSADATDVFQVPFTTDAIMIPSSFNDLEFSINDTGQIGPDGPWQAAVLMLGFHQRKSMVEPWDGGPVVPMWPTGSVITQLLTTAGGGFYNQSTNASQPWIEFGNDGENDMVLADYNVHQRSEGQGILDSITMMNSRFETPGYANINATIYAMNVSHVTLRDGTTTYVPQVGNLALGRPDDVDLGGTTWAGTSIIEQMKAQGHVKTNSFGLHLGSAPLGQKASLILGGYDEARVVGPVAAFQMMLGEPFVFLADVFLGVETGARHFNVSEFDAPIWQGDAIDAVNEHVGGKKGHVVVAPNPAVPGMYLPAPTCANAAKYLPVRYDNATGYYLWDTADPHYAPLINSAAFLGFTFADQAAKNVTIKVPLKLLNLTLDKPITQTPTAYFPCHDVGKDNDMWELGRAFLQAAFFAINFEQNLTFLAQAPGPAMSQSIVRPFQVDDRTLVSQPEAAFLDSWLASWPSAVPTDPPRRALSGGAIAGVAIGILAGLGAIAGAAFFLWRRRKRAKEGDPEPSELHTGGLHRHKKRRDSKSDGDINEVDSKTGVQEAADTPVNELESPVKVPPSEAPTSPGVYEMPTPLGFGSEAPTSPGVYEMPADPTYSKGEKRPTRNS
ncbi:aspartic peptidase domain-containing protein [Cercophora newfieldiana]|uniref:Aspartic peptidase domain-containing protein n=1 Tax=Cercophora newfieldiana TaxID=92897 RepID=A0AA39YLF8_9PEZI|nr:aspartic peptidase domain-containing protein [Cercophora newfieldiana]